MRAEDVGPALERLFGLRLMRGIRQPLHWHERPLYRFAARPDLGSDPQVQRNVARLAEYGWSFDLRLFAGQVAHGVTLCRACPEVTLVLQPAGMCGDVIHDFNDQIVNHVMTNHWMEPRVTGNHAGSKRVEKGAIKKLLNNYAFLLPIHDRPAKIERQQVVGRLGMQVPGPLTETLPARTWFPA